MFWRNITEENLRENILLWTIQGIASADPEGYGDVTFRRPVRLFVETIDEAPMAHKFAVGDSEVTEQDVANELAKDKDCLDCLFGGCTPIDLAILTDNVRGLDWLLRMGANPNNKTGMKCDWQKFDEDIHPGKKFTKNYFIRYVHIA